MKNNIVILGWAHDERVNTFVEYLTNQGVNFTCRHMDGSIRGFLTDSGLNYDEPIAFCNGNFIGNLEAVKSQKNLWVMTKPMRKIYDSIFGSSN